MAIGLVNKLGATLVASAGSTLTVPATTIGNLLVLVIGSAPSGQSSGAFTLSGGGTWTFGSTVISDTSRNETLLFAWAPCTSSVTSITLSLSGAGGAGVAYYELSGVNNSSPIDVQGGAAAANSVTLAPTHAGDFGVAVSASGNPSGSWSAGWTDNGTSPNFWYVSQAYAAGLSSGSQSVQNSAGVSVLAVMFAPSGGGTIINVSIAEAASLADSLSSSAAFAAAVAEALSLADSLSAAAAFAAALSEAMSLADTASTGGSPISVAIAEAMSLADAPASAARFAASLAEAMSFADVVSAGGSISAAITEAMSLADSLSSVAQFATAIVETAALADTLSAHVTFAAAIAEALSLVDTANLPTIVTAAIIEALSLVDAVTLTTPTVPKPQLTPPALLMTDAKEHRRQMAQAIQFLYQGKGPTPIDSFTLNANATSTTLIDARIGYYSHVTFMPQTADAAAVAASLWTPQSQQISGQLVVEHESTANTDCTFRVLIWG